MVRYSFDPETDLSKISKSRGSHLRIHFKHCREITNHIKGMPVEKAMKFMTDVLAFKAIVPFVRFTGGIGRKAQAKQNKTSGDKGRWPVKATAVVKDLLANAISNAQTRGLEPENLIVKHAQCNRAPAGRRRTYRAHGRIGKYASQPAHIEFILTEKKEGVQKGEEDMDEEKQVRITKKQAAKSRFVVIGGGTD
mmetsp:Transcript_6332/g.9271  ORF Transcript_6332/g.9271 Transcript_6332/m.9271 type:complete len:194 (+) Transcript_6332:114-695(+)|eukprot:CAMPEP_0172420278 /NCGR_PEP_ID=MMETSP1064-20121228/6681_1 /TAXON_ID=202472 /ORGANISM="Aulacoseira subarctica , Strain CCAP 1002/5" /LENGTH=193 /DNA_ID=CAMNT_0013160193 /DNA_START=321 /DNA_END=902 /DNA_ORIENTATION=+